MKSKYQFMGMVLTIHISLLVPFSEASTAVTTRPAGARMPNTQKVDSEVISVDDAYLDVATLIQDLRESLADGARPYDSIKIINRLAKLGADAGPAADILVDLLGKQLPDCIEELKVCRDKTLSCPLEKRICADGAEMHNYDYLTPYAFAALREIGPRALPRLSLAIRDEASNDENRERRKLAAGVMSAIGPVAIPFLAEIFRAPDHYGTRLLALAALNTVVANESASGNQLVDLVPYLRSFLKGDFETTDQAINILGAIGPGAAEAVPDLVVLLSYERVLEGFGACPVGERPGFIFRADAIRALVKIGTPEAMKAMEQYSERSQTGARY